MRTPQLHLLSHHHLLGLQGTGAIFGSVLVVWTAMVKWTVHKHTEASNRRGVAPTEAVQTGNPGIILYRGCSYWCSVDDATGGLGCPLPAMEGKTGDANCTGLAEEAEQKANSAASEMHDRRAAWQA